MDPRIDEPGDEARHPTLTDAGRAMLRHLTGHPAAPIFHGRSGSRLSAADMRDVAAFERETLTAPVDWRPGEAPGWVAPLIAHAHAQVPYYRALGSPPAELADVAPVSRADLSADIAAFVPDHVPVDRLITYRTTGTTGHPLPVPSHPIVAARYSCFHKRALARFGVVAQAGAGAVGVILLGHQRRCFTYASVVPSMGEAGLAKINLHPDDWADPADRARYLDAMAPEILAGDPISFAALLDLPVTLKPRALLSVSMMLTAGLRSRLEARFGCPVLDLYSMNEVGPVGVWDPAAGGHALLQPRLYVEILDQDGRCAPPGVRGEVCVTGGFNFCLPLLRYRTGDHAALAVVDGTPVLTGLAGRRPVRFRTEHGGWINNVDVSHALQPLAASRFTLHQGGDGVVTLCLPPAALNLAAEAKRRLRDLLGDVPVTIGTIDADDKVLHYTSDLPGASA